MKKPRKHDITVLLTAAFVFIAPPCQGETNVDGVIMDQLSNLYEPVVFDHLTHQEMYACGRCHHGGEDNGAQDCLACHGNTPSDTKNSCATCHSPSYTDNPQSHKAGQGQSSGYHIDTPGLIGAYHLLCRNCHLEDGGPIDCQECHSFTTKGAEFFHESK